MRKNILSAFTLAEVLIVVAVIGVIAMLTVPKVMKNYRNRVYSAQIRKVYSQVSDAIQSAMSDEHLSNFYETKVGKANVCSSTDSDDCTQGARYFLNKYFVSINKNCQTGTDKCIADTYTTLSGATVAAFSPDYCIRLKTGQAICMEYNATDKKTYIYADTNSRDLPNMSGKDLFYMQVEEYGTLSDYKDTSADDCGKNNPAGCLNKIIDNGWKMEY